LIKSTEPQELDPEDSDKQDTEDSISEIEEEDSVREVENVGNLCEGDPVKATTTTSSGRVSKAPSWMSEYSAPLINEIMAIGAGIGGGFTHTRELIPMKYKEAMDKDPVGWEKAVAKEHERMVSHNVWKAIPRHQENKLIQCAEWKGVHVGSVVNREMRGRWLS
jgi:hypothetical protein